MDTRTLALAALVMACAVASVSAQVPATSDAAKSATYLWFGELVLYEPGTNTMTVKSHMVRPDALDLKAFKVGERVTVQWSGFDAYSDAIRAVLKSSAAASASDRFLLPAELVSTETPNSYVTLKVRVPASSTSTVQTLKPGEWVRVTSAHRPASETDAVVKVEPFVARAAAAPPATK